MLPNTKRSQPKNWFMPLRPVASTTLQQDEVPAFVMYFEIKEKQGNGLVHTIFSVIRKGDKVIARNTMVYDKSHGHCQDHSDDIAEYPIANEAELVEEIKNHGLMMAMMLMVDPNAPATVDMSKPIIAMVLPKAATRDDFAKRIINDTDQEMATAKIIIANVFGLNSPAPAQDNKVTLSKKEDESVSEAQKLAKAAIEEDLIKRFGKKKMTELAKKMNYEGVTINKSRIKNNVSSN